MNVGIVVYSQSGNTLSVAEKLEDKIKAAGHSVTLERVEQELSLPSAAPLRLKSSPDISRYDVVIFAAPVHAFAAAPAMRLYLSEISSLTGKKVYCFVTQQLKKAWLGGNRAVRQITAACRAKGADIISSGIINWSCGIREKQTEDVIGRLSAF